MASTNLPDIPLTHEAEQLMSRITPLIREGLSEVRRVPVSVLLWGPSPDSASSLGMVRARLRKELRADGHAAFYSEELYDEALPYSLRIQQLIQAQKFDLVVSIPCTPGSIAEVHDFAADRRVTSKMLVFLNEQHLHGYGPQSLQALSSILSCQLEYYSDEEDCDRIMEITYDNVQRIREMKYLLMGRY